MLTPTFMRFTAPDPAVLERRMQDAEHALEAALHRGDRRAVVDHAADLGGMLTTARREAEAVALLRRHEAAAQALSGEVPSEESVAWFWNALATALQYVDQREGAQAYFERAVAHARAGGWRRIEAMALHHWGRCLVERGRLDQAMSCLQQALALREALNAGQESTRLALAELHRLRAAGAP